MSPLKVLLLHGPTASGKSFMTERVLGIEYDVHTAKMDGIYYQALAHAEVPLVGRAAYSVYKEAHRMRDGEYDEATTERFFAKFTELVQTHAERAHRWNVGLVFEGYTLKFPDEVRLIADIARAQAGNRLLLRRLYVRPTLERWNRNRVEKFARMGKSVEDSSPSYYERRMVASEPVQGVQDGVVADVDELRAFVDDTMKIRRHRWYQRVSLGPIETTGPSDAREKVSHVLGSDVEGKRVLDVCCATGVHAILLKARGAHRVVGVENDTRRYCKALELRKTLVRHSDIDAKVDVKLGDALRLVPTLGRFNTTVLFGAIHYFEDYSAVLGMIAGATTDVAYIEFTFSEGEHDTATRPGTIAGYTRSKSGRTIYLGDRDAVLESVRQGMPDFEVEKRVPISPPGRASDREIWCIRRTPKP